MTAGIQNISGSPLEISSLGINLEIDQIRSFSPTENLIISDNQDIIDAITNDEIILVQDVDTEVLYTKQESLNLVNRSILNIPPMLWPEDPADNLLIWDGDKFINSTIGTNDLNDIVITSPTTNDVLSYNGGNWVNAEPGASTGIQPYDADLAAMASLANTDGNFIVGNGSTWVAESGNTARTSLGLGTGNTVSFNQLNLTGAGTNTFAGSLVMASATGGQQGAGTINATGLYINGLAVTAGISDLDDLGDVLISAPANGQVLSYNGSNWVNTTPATPNIFGSGGILTGVKVWIGTATSNGSSVFTANISSAGFSSIISVQATAQQNTSDIQQVPLASITSATTTTITGSVVESNNTGVLLGGNIEGLEFAGSGVVVNIVVWGQ